MPAPVITGAPAAMFGLGPAVQLDADQPVRWASDVGFFSLVGGGAYLPGVFTGSIMFTPTNWSRDQTVTAANAADEATTVEIAVRADYPRVPHLTNRFELDKPGLVSGTNRVGDVTGRVVGQTAGGLYTLEMLVLAYTGRRGVEADEVMTFWERHYPPNPPASAFRYTSRLVPRASGLFTLESKIEGGRAGAVYVDFTVVIKRYSA